MTDPASPAPVLQGAIERAILAALRDVGSAPAARFVGHLGDELLAIARAGVSYGAEMIRAGPYWEIFIGRYGADHDGTVTALVGGLWAVECELHGTTEREYQEKFNKLIVARVEQRLFVMPVGTSALSRLQTQVNVANVPVWIAEVTPLDDWRDSPDFSPRVKLRYFTPRR